MGKRSGIKGVVREAVNLHLLAITAVSNAGEGVGRVAIALLCGALLDNILAVNRAAALTTLLYILIATLVFGLCITVKDGALGAYFERALRLLRGKAVAAVGRAPMAWLDSKHSGELSALISNDINALGDALRPVLILGISWIIVQLIATVSLFIIHWQLALIMFAVVPVIAVIQWVYSGSIKRYQASSQSAVGRLSAIIFDCFGSYESVKSLALEGEMRKRFGEAQGEQNTALIRQSGVTAALTPLSMLGQYLPQAILFIVGALFAIDGRITTGTIMTFLMISSAATGIFGSMTDLIASIRRLSVCADRLMKILNMQGERAGGVTSPMEGGAAVSLRDVGFAYGEGSAGARAVLSGVSMDIPRGSSISLVGRSGSGKSTILKLIAGLYPSDEGAVAVLGVPVSEWDLSAMRERIAYVAQDTYLFPGSMRDNIVCDRPYDAARFAEAIRAACLTDLIASLADGEHTHVGERGALLSGGERQRVAIARALYRGADILLFDEATSALDKPTEAAVMRNIRALPERPAACVMITHHLANTYESDSIVFMEDGRAAHRGTFDELCEAVPIFARMLAEQGAQALTGGGV